MRQFNARVAKVAGAAEALAPEKPVRFVIPYVRPDGSTYFRIGAEEYAGRVFDQEPTAGDCPEYELQTVYARSPALDGI